MLLFLLTTELFAMAFIVLGAVGLVKRKPIFVSQRIFLALTFLILFPGFFGFLNFGVTIHNTFLLVLIVLTLIIFLIFGLRVSKNNFLVIGVSREIFRDALKSSLESMNIEFREKHQWWSSLSVLSSGIAFTNEASIGWITVFDAKQDKKTINLLKDHMHEYFVSKKIKASTELFLFCLLFAGLHITIVIWGLI